MGDRGNIVVVDGASKVYLYTHWNGSDLVDIARAACTRAVSERRIDDGPYLARIVFCEMIGADKGTTGFGISGEYGDGGSDWELNVDKQTFGGIPIADFIAGAEPTTRWTEPGA